MFAQPTGRMTLEVLSPIHIGTGDTLDTLEYVAGRRDEDDAAPAEMEIYDLAKAAHCLTPKQRKLIEDNVIQNNFVKLRNDLSEMLWSETNLEPALIRAVQADPEVETTYTNELNQPRSALEIHPTMIQPVKRTPFIPGSTVKGALRTAWLNELVASGRCAAVDFRGRRWEQEIFGDPRQDPFRLLSVGDVEFSAKTLFVTQVFNVRAGCVLTGKGQKTFRLYFEFIQPGPAGKPACGEGKLTWSDPSLSPANLGARLSGKLNGNRPPSLRSILAAARKDAKLELTKEVEFYGNATAAGVLAVRLLKLLETLKENETLVKLGRFGGVYAKTLEGKRNPRTRKNREGVDMGYGKTRFIAYAPNIPETNLPSGPRNGLVSCGWCKLSGT
jgi:hypothetical protein